MISTLTRCVVALVAIASFTAPAPGAVTIYEDDFTLDPSATGATGRTGFTTGWTEQVGVADLGTIDISTTGSAAAFTRTQSDSAPESAEDFARITRTFSTVGYEDIAVDLTAYQSSTQFEANFDLLLIEYSTDGSTFSNLIVDRGALQTPITNEPSPGSGTGQNGNTNTSNSTGLLLIPTMDAWDNANFTIRIRANFNAEPEAYFLNNFLIQGNPIPEPASLGLLAVGAVGLLRRRRR